MAWDGMGWDGRAQNGMGWPEVDGKGGGYVVTIR